LNTTRSWPPVPSPLAHYAVGAAGLHLTDLPRRKLAIVGLWSAAPDLDALPALAWNLLAPRLDLGAEALRTGAWITGHRGFSHTFAAALLVGLLVWGYTRRRKPALLAGGLWAFHIVLDTLTDWSTAPFWPISDQAYMAPIVTGLDPLLTLASIGAVLALLGPVIVEKLGWPGPNKRAKVDRWGHRWGRPLAYASLAAVVFSASMVGWTALASDDRVALPANAPRTASLDQPIDAEAETWTVTTRWVPPGEGDTRVVPYAANASQAPEGVLPAAECAFEAIGPFAPVDRPIWELRDQGDRWVATAQDLVRNATGTEGPRLHVAVANGTLEEAWVTGGQDEEPAFRSTIPKALLEDAACP
jgi:membrane-bound metal-dependent hydrolase YbcI (DUF457 family)